MTPYRELPEDLLAETVRVRARRLVRAAVMSGELVRPSYCERCGQAPQARRDGRSAIQGHHHKGYHRPLDVQWLCARCHRAETPLPAKMGAPTFGSKNGAAKLQERDIPCIRGLHAEGLGCKRIAAMFGVDKKTIQYIFRRETWNVEAR